MFFKRSPQEAARDLTMRQVLAVSKTRRFPAWRQWLHAGRVLSGKEKRVVAGAWSAVVLGTLFLAGTYVFAHRFEMPAEGGAYTEALIGEPLFINPLYAPTNDTDADLARLVYSGLLRRDPSQGLVNDLATDVKTSDDGKTYTVTLRTDAVFHNGDPVLPKDILFTFDALKNPLYRSPLAGAYQDVETSQTDDRTVVFTLANPNAFFPSLLTVGILPSDLWSSVAPRNTPLATYNLKPIGSGPYLFKEFEKDQKGSIRTYTLVRNPDYYGTKPNMNRLMFKFYEDAGSAVKALASRNVEGIAYVPPELEADVEKTKATHILRPEIPRETTLFFNQDRQPLFKTKALRQAIALVLDRQAIIGAALNGHGVSAAGPVLSEALNVTDVVPIPTPDIAAANALLDGAGFPRQTDGTRIVKPATPAKGSQGKTPAPSTPKELSFTLTTVQVPEFVQAAEMIATELASIGIKIQIEATDVDDLQKTTLGPRNYELLLTGLSYGNDPDPYPFWHSSQATSHGLNLANYANKKADDLLVQARQTLDAAARAKVYAAFQAQVQDDVPAISLYRPTYAYAVGTKVKGVAIDRLSVPSDRFANVVDWYVKTAWRVK